MTVSRTSARNGKGVAASDAAGESAVSGVGPEHKRDASASRLLVWKWWFEVFKSMLKLFGYSEWAVAAKGDCQLLAFAAGHEMKEKQTVEKPTAKQTQLFVTNGMRKPAVAFLCSGKADGFQAALGPDGVAMVAAMKRLYVNSISQRATLVAMRERLKPWLSAQYFGTDGYSILAALGVLKSRVSHHPHSLYPYLCSQRTAFSNLHPAFYSSTLLGGYGARAELFECSRLHHLPRRTR